MNSAPIMVCNTSSPEQFKTDIIESITKRLRISLAADYNSLWNNKEMLFPHLVFCPSIANNFSKLQVSYILQIYSRLEELEHYFSTWNLKFDFTQLKNASPESDSTLKEFEQEHTFRDVNGDSYVASWHVRFTGIEGRIFFIPYYKERKALICYIGKKLPNVTYPT